MTFSRNLLLGLCAANALVAGALVWRLAPGNVAVAQDPAGGARRPSEFLVIQGEVNGSTAGLVYMLDTANGELMAVSPNNRDQLEGMRTPLNVADLFRRATEQGGLEPAAPGNNNPAPGAGNNANPGAVGGGNRPPAGVRPRNNNTNN